MFGFLLILGRVMLTVILYSDLILGAESAWSLVLVSTYRAAAGVSVAVHSLGASTMHPWESLVAM